MSFVVLVSLTSCLLTVGRREFSRPVPSVSVVRLLGSVHGRLLGAFRAMSARSDRAA